MIKSDFYSRGVRCAGDLYLPHDVENPPIVVMGHGFAAEKCFRLPAYAERFLAKGIAAFLFDYRCFGESDGEPRHWVTPRRQLHDWTAALAHVRSLPDINHKKTAIWGSSFGGGHVIAVAARDPNISAVVSQVPYVGPGGSLTGYTPGFMVKCFMAAIRDVFRMLTYREPYYVPVIGRPADFAAMNTEESWDGYSAIIPEGSKWENKFTPRFYFTLPFYSPLRLARKVKAPTLLMAGKRDSLSDEASVKKEAQVIENCELIIVDCNHFEPYHGKFFDVFADAQTEFLVKHLVS
jgi:pimeloyl-ACP methyl ester carboxylesterase